MNRSNCLVRRYPMIKTSVIGLVLSSILLAACNKGLTPPDIQSTRIEFPILPEGGNPVGFWLPDTTRPVDVTLLDEFPVDSIVFQSKLEGVFSLEVTGICSVNATIAFRPLIYNLGQVLELDIAITDTLLGMGPYEIIEDNALYLPVESNVLDFDTLGFTSQMNSLDLITLPAVFTFENTISLRFYSVIHLIRQDRNVARPANFLFTLRKKEGAY